jgi:hypothetical protein
MKSFSMENDEKKKNNSTKNTEFFDHYPQRDGFESESS